MIQSFGNRLAEDLFDDRLSAVVRRFPPELRRAARRKLLYLHDAAELRDPRVPPGLGYVVPRMVCPGSRISTYGRLEVT